MSALHRAQTSSLLNTFGMNWNATPGLLKPTPVPDLTNELTFTTDTLQNHVESFPRRLEDIINTKGGNSKLTVWDELECQWGVRSSYPTSQMDTNSHKHPLKSCGKRYPRGEGCYSGKGMQFHINGFGMEFPPSSRRCDGQVSTNLSRNFQLL